MNKDVFISHSSSDFAFAGRLCEIFEENQLSCWIAPRDIPYGEVWSEQITDGIENSRVMIFIFTENSNQSREVLNEINMALQNGVTIVPIRLSQEPYNKALKYFLSLHQWIDINADDAEDAIVLLAERVRAFLNGEDVFEKITDSEGIDVEWNVDDELDAKFSHIFDEDSSENAPVSNFKKRLLDRISEKYAEQMFIHSEEDSVETVTDVEDGDSICFSVAEADCTTLAFIVRRKIDEETFVESYYTEMLECEREALSDGRTRVRFSVDYFDREGNPLILISFPKDKAMALIDKGFLDKDSVYLSNKPEVKEFVNLYSKEEGVLKRYRANENARTILIDPTNCCIVPRQRYFDRKLKEWVYYVEIVPDKRYFAFKIMGDNGKKADKFNVAYGYYKGRYGLKRNVVEAAALFDEIGTKEAYAYLAQIFKEDPLLKNEEDYLYYLNKSKE